MQMISKKADLTTKEIVVLLSAIMGVIVIIVVLYTLISPIFDKKDETAKSYLETFESQIEIVNSGKFGEFLIWDIENSEEADYFLVYFGELSSFSYKGISLTSLNKNTKNKICICSIKKETSFCNYCRNLDMPVVYEGKEENFVIGAGEKIAILKKEEFYEFKKV